MRGNLQYEIRRLEDELRILKRDKKLLLGAIAHCSRHNKKLIRDRLREKKASPELLGDSKA